MERVKWRRRLKKGWSYGISRLGLGTINLTRRYRSFRRIFASEWTKVLVSGKTSNEEEPCTGTIDTPASPLESLRLTVRIPGFIPVRCRVGGYFNLRDPKRWFPVSSLYFLGFSRLQSAGSYTDRWIPGPTYFQSLRLQPPVDTLLKY